MSLLPANSNIDQKNGIREYYGNKWVWDNLILRNEKSE